MKHTKWIAVLAALTLVFVACPNGNNDSNDSPQKSDAATHTITFDADGGTFAQGEDGFTLSEDKTKLTVTVQHGKAIPKPSVVPTKPADESGIYVFYYWIEEDLLPEFDFTKTATEDLTLYAFYTSIPALDESDFTDDDADRDGDGESDGKVHDSTSDDANAVKGLHVDGSDSALYFWWDWASGASGYRAVLSVPASDDSVPYVVEVKDITEKSGESGNEYGEAFFIGLENGQEYLLTLMPLGAEGAAFATLAASALAAPQIERESPDVLLLLYLDKDGDLEKVSEGLSAVRTENGSLTVDAVAFQSTDGGDAHLFGFDDDEDGSQVDISYTWEGIDRAQDSDGSYFIKGVDFTDGAFFRNLLSWARERFEQKKLVAYIEATVDTAALAAAIESANAELVGGKKIDVIVFDGKNDSSLESLWPLASCAEYIAASPDDAHGVDVAKLIKSFKTGATAESIAKAVADNYAKDNERTESDWKAVETEWKAALPNAFSDTLNNDDLEAALNFYALTSVPAFTVVRGAKLGDLVKAWDELAQAISEAGDSDFTITDDETGEETDYLDMAKMLFSSPAIANGAGDMTSLYYTGTFGEDEQAVWKYDIGYAAAEIKDFIEELASADPAVDTTELETVKEKASAVLSALKAAVVQSWRTSKGESTSLYEELLDDEDNAIPCGITVTGARMADDDTLTVPTDGKTPDGYTMAFGTTYSHWAALLSQWFD